MTKAISLLSGGLDSILATRLILNQGIEVEALNFVTAFCTSKAKGKDCISCKKAADSLGVQLKIFKLKEEYFEIVKNPKYGYGRNFNPCLDCRILILKKASEYMKKTGASFIFTGEVLGERPMSQRKDAMNIAEKDSGLKGFLLRPLSAKLLEPTVPEKKGLVDREKLLSIQGRSRKPQIQLAREFGIDDYPTPAGGCLLTDPGFSKKMRDIIKHNPDFNENDINLLKVGRHFRLGPQSKFVVGRNEEENKKLLALTEKNDFCLYPLKAMGPTGLGRGRFDKNEILTASRIIARYSDGDINQQFEIAHRKTSSEEPHVFTILPVDRNNLENLRI